jgi:glycosyltransferase involved in cell wall biosynthesis
LKPIEEYKRTYPNKVFDYMAAGRPVILAIDGEIRSVVEAAGCGIFVQPGNPAALADVMCKLAADRPVAKEMGLNGRKYLEEHFNRNLIADTLEMILADLIARR